MISKKNDFESAIMWSYKLTYDTMFAPNPLWGILTLATCKPRIRRSPNSKKGTWIAGWTACTLHNSPLQNKPISYCKRGEEKLIYLAQIDETIALDKYWEKYPQKRPIVGCGINHATYYGDNIYHKESNGDIIQAPNNSHYKDDIQKDFYNGQYALVCKKFFYFTMEKRLYVPEDFRSLIHAGVGQSLKSGELVYKFIDYVTDAAAKQGVNNGIVGNINIDY